jgi:hypothetical protein
MSDARKPKFKEAAEEPVPPKVDLRSEPQSAPDKPLGPEQLYLKRKAEVTQQDNEAFAEYLQEKRARDWTGARSTRACSTVPRRAASASSPAPRSLSASSRAGSTKTRYSPATITEADGRGREWLPGSRPPIASSQT